MITLENIREFLVSDGIIKADDPREITDDTTFHDLEIDFSSDPEIARITKPEVYDHAQDYWSVELPFQSWEGWNTVGDFRKTLNEAQA